MEVPAGPPVELILEHELLNGRLRRALVWHTTDRWYLGDFLRHTAWITCVSQAAAQMDVATHRSYLPLLAGDQRIHELIDTAVVGERELADYDLVVIPSTFPPASFHPTVARGLYWWDSGWTYARHGTRVADGTTTRVNYFRTARHDHGQTALPTATAYTLQLPPEERHAASMALRATFENDRPVIVYNPTASNPITRRTTAAKEVANVLTMDQHATLLRAIRERLPAYGVLIGSALVPGDEENRGRIAALSGAFGDPAVRSIAEVPTPDATTLRGFALLLGSGTVAASVGTSTGTNAHLAAVVGIPGFSVERGVDEAIRTTWGDGTGMAMGSLRWRNPSPLAGAITIDWENIGPDHLERAANAFSAFVDLHTRGTHRTPDGAADDMAAAAADLLDTFETASADQLLALTVRLVERLPPLLRSWAADFSEELAYLSHQRSADLPDLDSAAALPGADDALVRECVRDSMLHKFAQLAAGQVEHRVAQPTSRHLAIFRAVRANAPLSDDELSWVGVRDEHELAAILRRSTSAHNDDLFARVQGCQTKAGWQCVTYLATSSTVVKQIRTNRASEYLSDDYTRRGIDHGLECAGGLVPHSSSRADDRFASAAISMFMETDRRAMTPAFGGLSPPKTNLPLGWLDELVANHVALFDRGAINFDIGLKNCGIDRYGVFRLADFSVCWRVDQCRPAQDSVPNRRIDVYHMAINELIREAQHLSEFANGPALVDHFLRLVQQHLGLELRAFVDGWQWGDHDDPRITPLAEHLRRLAEHRARLGRPRPVYPLVDPASERLVFEALPTLHQRTGVAESGAPAQDVSSPHAYTGSYRAQALNSRSERM